jgi:hypothetical protein
MSQTDVHAALSTKLGTISGEEIAWENSQFEPTLGTRWIREVYAPAPMVQSSLGTAGYNRLTGVYFLDVFTPVGRGWKDAEELVEILLEAFPRGAVLTAGSVEVRVERSYRSEARVEDHWYHVPLAIEFRADIEPY